MRITVQGPVKKRQTRGVGTGWRVFSPAAPLARVGLGHGCQEREENMIAGFPLYDQEVEKDRKSRKTRKDHKDHNDHKDKKTRKRDRY
jgi:hypothetical protein